MIQLLKLGSIGFLGSKALKVLNKDYGDILQFITILYVAITIFAKIGGWYNAFMECELIQLLQKIF